MIYLRRRLKNKEESMKRIFKISSGIIVHQRGHGVAHLVKAMSYKPEGRGFDSQLCHWNLSLT